jgi:poly [ADP-ribose] polymerase
LSGQFYTVIPHKLGRSRADVLESVINSANKVKEKEDTLQLMRDMLNVSGKGVNVLTNPDVEKKYIALGCEIGHLSKDEKDFTKMKDYVNKSKSYGSVKIKNLFTVKRPQEHKEFASDIGNHKLLFHGSRAHNWVGILSRGLMLPKQVTKLGVSRTDEGWLGHGIYFGDSIDTALNYAGSSKQGSTFVTIARVALGKIRVYTDITHGLTSPPKGYDSCHGNPDKDDSEFDDHEFVIYDTKQQRLEYLLELGY